MGAIKRTCSTILPDLNLKRRRLTRFQERQIRSVFRFLDLPGELKNIIYENCIDISAAQHILQRYYDSLRDCTDLRAVEAPLVWSKTPTILLINRQIHAEASFYLRNRSLTFDHGLLDLVDVTDFVSPNLFRTVTSITIDDSGHPLFQPNILAASWVGYTSLVQQLGDILSEGHQLKTFTLSLTNKDLIPHVTTCWNGHHVCGFRDSLLKACDALRAVRNVGLVTFRGLPEPLSSQLKARMESAPINFLDLPSEIRNAIYGEALDWSDINKQLARTIRLWSNKNLSPPFPALTTPTVLLLNRQISAEAQAVLHRKPLTLVFPRDHGMQKQDHVPNMLKFITPSTLLNVEHLVLELHSWEWIYSLDHFLPVFASPSTATTTAIASARPSTITPTRITAATLRHHNLLLHPHPTTTITTSAPPALKTIHIHFADTLKSEFLVGTTQQYPDETLHLSLSQLAKLRGLERVTFTGDLPACYTAPLTQIMRTSPAAAAVGAAALPKLRAVKASGEVVAVEDGEKVVVVG
ncbi:hypothetical protein B0A55_07474 [Friedmanniomyces simplex]|uniref:F-box domain-containing protein n=1 Tax=Friedmanniomyces simplex TaxID=329884 RepID=A0A4V6WKY3_9PEZI|nr:hypothetical protein B0A55_07474 [Friedmanniomyces simplex]